MKLLLTIILPVVLLCGCTSTQKAPPVIDPLNNVANIGMPEQHYIVNTGDCLWDISAKGNVYGDAFKWVLIYKINRDQIENPDFIELNQDLKVKKDYDTESIAEAVQKAKDCPPYKAKHK